MVCCGLLWFVVVCCGCGSFVVVVVVVVVPFSDLFFSPVNRRVLQVKYFKQYVGTHSRTSKTWTADVGYERFLGPEMFFNPEIFSTDFKTPLSEVVDSSIINCKIKIALRGTIQSVSSVLMFVVVAFFSCFVVFHQVQLILDVVCTKTLCCRAVPQCSKILVEDCNVI